MQLALQKSDTLRGIVADGVRSRYPAFSEEQVRFGGEVQVYPSSAEGRRGFCPRCGTQIFFRADYIPGLVDLTIGSMDQPEALPPQLHYWHGEHLYWAEFADGLPRHPEFPPQG